MYQVAKEFQNLKAILNSEGDNQEGLQEAIEQAFSDLMNDQANGAEVAARLIREQEAYNVATDIEIKRLQDIVRARKLRVDRAKNAVKISMIYSDTKSIETTIGKFSLGEGSESTAIHNEDLLVSFSIENEEAAEAVKIDTVRKPDKKEIKRLIKLGVIPAEIASLVRGEKSISFK